MAGCNLKFSALIQTFGVSILTGTDVTANEGDAFGRFAVHLLHHHRPTLADQALNQVERPVQQA